MYKNEKKNSRDFGIDEYYFTLNSPFFAEKRVNWLETFTVYSTSLREALKLEKNDKYFICLFSLITNNGASVIALVKLRGTKVCYEVQFWKKLLATTFSPMHEEYFCEILIWSVDKYLFYE